MKKSPKELLEAIEAAERGKGRDRYYEASCPFCPFTETASVLGSDDAAQVAAKGKVLTHVRFVHPKQIAG